MYASEPRSKRQRVPRETFSPAKEQSVKDTPEYRHNERERQELRKPPEYHEAVALLKGAHWKCIVGKYHDKKNVWIAPDKFYHRGSKEDEDFFTDPVRAVEARRRELELDPL
jgi:hypothetical protein